MPLRRRISNLRARLQETIEEAQSQALARMTQSAPLAKPGEDPPVVARLMVEIRSDGSRTIARGAIEDVASGERVTVEAQGATPAQLVASLTKTLFATPFLARAAVRAVLDGRKTPKAPDDEAE